MNLSIEVVCKLRLLVQVKGGQLSPSCSLQALSQCPSTVSRPGPPLLFLWPPCLSLSLSHCSLAAGLCMCGCCLHTQEGRGQADFSILLRTMCLLMHLSALCFINELQCGHSREKEVSMRRWESDTLLLCHYFMVLLHCTGLLTVILTRLKDVELISELRPVLCSNQLSIFIEKALSEL